MGTNRIEYFGKVLIDLTEDTVTPETLAAGVTAHDKTGAEITGTMDLSAELEEYASLNTELESVINSLPEAGSGGTDSSGSDELVKSIIERNVTEVSSSANHIGQYVFCETSTLTTVDFPNATYVGAHAFERCTGLTKVNMPLVIDIEDNAFYLCSALQTIDIQGGGVLFNNAFYLSGLKTLILRSTSNVTTLASSTVFSFTPIADGTGKIYVPSALVSSYKADSDWSTYASQIYAIEDYPEVTGG